MVKTFLKALVVVYVLMFGSKCVRRYQDQQDEIIKIEKYRVVKAAEGAACVPPRAV